MKKCSYHNTMEPLENFSIKTQPSTYHSSCRAGRNAMATIARAQKKAITAEEEEEESAD